MQDPDPLPQPPIPPPEPGGAVRGPVPAEPSQPPWVAPEVGYGGHWHLWTYLLSGVLPLLAIWMAVDAYKRYRGLTYWHWLLFVAMPIATPVYFIIHFRSLLGGGGGGLFQPSLKSRIKTAEQNLRISDTVASHMELGELLFEAKEYARCEEEYKKVLAADPESLEARYHLGACRLELGDVPAAFEHLDWVCQRDRKLRFGLAALRWTTCLWKLGRKDEALEESRKLHRTYPRPLFEYAYAELLAEAGEKEKARAVLEELIETAQSAPKEDRSWLGKAKSLRRGL